MDFRTPCTALFPRWDDDAPPLMDSNESSIEPLVIRVVVVVEGSSSWRILGWVMPTLPLSLRVPSPQDAASLARLDRWRNAIPDDDRTTSSGVSSFDLPRRTSLWSELVLPDCNCNTRDDDAAVDNMNGPSLASDPSTSSRNAMIR